MTAWRPSSPAATAHRRAAMLRRARDYFAAEQALEVDTPALGTTAGSDLNIEPFAVPSATGAEYFLHTSPEFCMKRLLAAGYPDIFSICRVYRDGESGSQHLAEFTMLEWYRLGYGLADIVADTLGLLARCLEQHELTETSTVYDYREAFRELAGIDPLRADSDELADCSNADDDLREAIGSDRNSWLDLILATIVAPQFATDRLTVLQHYPASMAALARPNQASAT